MWNYTALTVYDLIDDEYERTLRAAQSTESGAEIHAIPIMENEVKIKNSLKMK